MSSMDTYCSPLSSRYASHEMSHIFSPQFKFTTWRKLWVALASAQGSLGLPITEAQIHSLEQAIGKVDITRAEELEKTFRHDVMAHIHAYGEQCPDAKGIIHLGATSCYVTDNTDLIQCQEGLKLLRNKMVQALRHLNTFARQHSHLACLSYTHLQAAQPTTVGKRACLWAQDLLLDLHSIEHTLHEIRFLGVKGATGTQASFLTLFEGNHDKVKKLDFLVAKKMGFGRTLSISGQTYTRKQDITILNALTSFAASSHKCATDIRLLSHLKEIEEPFSSTQVGSSAMPYKRNPMRSERICGIARFLISLGQNPLYTEATQWLERTLDDSANRRLYIPEAFLAADAILNLLCNITENLIVHPKMITKHLNEELPFLATEHILMEAVKKGQDRQQIHENLRIHSIESGKRVKEEALPCDLFERIANDPAMGLSRQELNAIAHVENFTGRAAEQTLEFLDEEVAPILKKYAEMKALDCKISI